MAVNLSSSPKSVLDDGFSATFETLKPQKEPEEPLVQLAGDPPKSDTKPPVEDKSGVRAQTEAQIAATRATRDYEEAKRAQSKGETAAKEAREAAVYAEYKPRLTAPYESFKPTGDTASSLASLGLMIGMLGAMGGTKGLTSATGAMNAIAGMMTGYQEGSKEKYNKERQIFEENLKVAQQNRDILSKKIESLNDSITKLDIDVLNLESEEISGNELGTIKYMSELLDWDIKKTANLFILILIFVFDPLAITLVIATNQAFKGKRKEEDNPQVTPQVKEETIQQPTNNQPSTEQVEVITEESDDNEFNVPNNLLDLVEEVIENKEIETVQEVTQPIEPVINRRLSYTKNDTGNFKINRL
jgi:hypothetical protein